MGRYRKRPVEVEALPFDGSRASIDAICRWANKGAAEPIVSYLSKGESHVFDVQLETLNGPVTLSAGDYVVRGVQGEFYPCDPDVFAQTYEPVEGG